MLTSTSLTALLPVTVKLLSCVLRFAVIHAAGDADALPPQEHPHGGDPQFEPRTRRHHGIAAPRRHASQLANSRMCRHSSCITGSNVSTSSGGKKPDRLASANRPKAKKLSMHSLKPVTR